MQEVELEYHPNPYHSSLHAADVTQALGAMLGAGDAFVGQLSDLELLALLVAAVVHDLGHPGRACFGVPHVMVVWWSRGCFCGGGGGGDARPGTSSGACFGVL